MKPTRRLLDFAARLATEAGEITLRYFQRRPRIDTKPDGSYVTQADRRAERHICRRIREAFPSHGILGEEYGETPGREACRWIIDPLDGTASFVQGAPLYGVLLALEIEGRAALGVAHFPALRETVCAAEGLGCWWNGRRARVSGIGKLEDGLLLATDARGKPWRGREAGLRRLQARTRAFRTWGDCYGHILVATGRAEVMLDPKLKIWDCAALQPILEEAGGTFTDWNGTPTHLGSCGVSTNGRLFKAVRRLL